MDLFPASSPTTLQGGATLSTEITSTISIHNEIGKRINMFFFLISINFKHVLIEKKYVYLSFNKKHVFLYIKNKMKIAEHMV